MLFKEWLEEWLQYCVKATAKQRTFSKYASIVQRYVVPSLGNCNIDSLSAVQLQKFSLSLVEKGLSPNTVNGIITVLMASLRKAHALGVSAKSFADCLSRPKFREKKVESFSVAEQRKLENYVLSSKRQCHCGIIICLYTGLRIGELLALTWDDVNLAKGILRVTKSCRDSWQNGKYGKIIDTPKTASSEREIPMPRQLLSLLRTLKKQSRGKYVVEGRTEQGAQIRTYQRMFTNLLAQLKIAHKGFHALRHTFATRALEVGMDVKTLSEILGHKNPSVTLSRYAHSFMEHKTEMMNKVGSLLR